MTRTSVRYDDGALSPARRNDRRRSIDDLTHKGHTPHEIAETLDYTTQTITGEISRIRKRSRDLFRRERAAERAQAYADCRRLQQRLWKVIDLLVPRDNTHEPDPKAVPPAARALLDAIKLAQALRDADDKHIQDGEITVRDVYATLDPAFFDGPRPSPLSTTRAADAPGAAPPNHS